MPVKPRMSELKTVQRSTLRPPFSIASSPDKTLAATFGERTRETSWIFFPSMLISMNMAA